jgi:hypothetical protein
LVVLAQVLCNSGPKKDEIGKKQAQNLARQKKVATLRSNKNEF